MVKNLSDNAGDTRDVGSIPGLGKPPGVGNGNPLQYSCLENPHGQKSLFNHGGQTQLSAGALGSPQPPPGLEAPRLQTGTVWGGKEGSW